MGRKKLKREYCITVTVDGKLYYLATNSFSGHYGMRLVEHSGGAYIIKTREKLENKIRNILLNNDYSFLVKGEVIVTPDDYLDLTINLAKENFEDAKNKYKNARNKIIENDFLDNMPCPITDINNYSSRRELFNSTSNEISVSFRNALKYYERYRDALLERDRLLKSNYKFKKIELSILDASFNFRYSKLKKLIEEND